MQFRSIPAEVGGGAAELFPSYSAVEARREWEIEFIKEKLAKNERVDLPICRVERTSANSETLRFGLKRGKLLYVFKYPTHDVERDKHRNVITRARFIRTSLEVAGFRLIPWDFKKNRPPTFWEGGTMEEEDDDLYGPSDTAVPTEAHSEVKGESDDEQEDEPMDEGLESGEEEQEDSDSDLEIIIDKPQNAPKPVAQGPQESKAIKIEAPPQPSSTSTTKQTITAAPSVPQQPGTAYPAVRTSNVDINADPVYPAVGKPVSQIDMDADLAESTKPWRLPGADQSDYFNYGFDEFTWEMYRQRQSNLSNTLATQKAETAQFQQMFMPGMSAAPPTAPAAGNGGGGGAGNAGGVPGAPTGPAAQSASAAMPGMPGVMNEEQMQMMMAQMQAQGMDMGNMDFNSFMQMAGGMSFGGQQGGFGGGGQQGNQGGGGRGSGRRGRGW